MADVSFIGSVFLTWARRWPLDGHINFQLQLKKKGKKEEKKHNPNPIKPGGKMFLLPHHSGRDYSINGPACLSCSHPPLPPPPLLQYSSNLWIMNGGAPCFSASGRPGVHSVHSTVHAHITSEHGEKNGLERGSGSDRSWAIQFEMTRCKRPTRRWSGTQVRSLS